jgi:hypothetical protein
VSDTKDSTNILQSVAGDEDAAVDGRAAPQLFYFLVTDVSEGGGHLTRRSFLERRRFEAEVVVF